MTNFWEHQSGAKEIAQIHRLADACKAAKASPSSPTSLSFHFLSFACRQVSHVVFSTLDDTRQYIASDGRTMPLLEGRFNVPHYDAKGEGQKRFTEIGVPTTFLTTSMHMENFLFSFAGGGFSFPAPKCVAQGKLRITLPLGKAKLPLVAVSDIGRVAVALLKDPKRIGTSIGLSGDQLTGHELAAVFTKVLGVQTEYESPSRKEWRKHEFPGSTELASMLQFYVECEREHCAKRDPTLCRELVPDLQTFEQWLMQHKAAFSQLAA